jgi:hypothetical protein
MRRQKIAGVGRSGMETVDVLSQNNNDGGGGAEEEGRKRIREPHSKEEGLWRLFVEGWGQLVRLLEALYQAPTQPTRILL